MADVLERRGPPVAGRARLRAVTAEDEVEFVRLAAASVVLHDPWIVVPRSAGEFRPYLAQFDGERAAGFVVCRRDTGEIAGFINLTEIVRGVFLRGTIGYGVFAPSVGRGYMTEGLALLVHHAFDGLGLHRVEADIQPGNLRSKSLVRRVGFRHEGYSPGYAFINGAWRDHERWAITNDA
jgi:ribosomal-protein-alanine N-acetyltransferase